MHTIRLIVLILLLTLPVTAQTAPGNIQPDVPGGVGNLQNAVAANGNGSAVNVQGFGAAIIVVALTGSGTPVVTFKGRVLSSGSYTVRNGYLKTDSTKTLVTTTSTSGEYYIDCAGDYDVTAPVSGTWSGTVTVTIKRVPATARVGAPSGGVSGSGTNGQFALWGASALTGDSDAAFSGDTATFTKAIIGGGSAITSSGPGGALTALGFTSPGTGVATALGVNVGSAGALVVNGGALGSPSSAGTLPAFTLGGTVSGGGQQLNNVIIGTTTPLAGSFTTVTATTINGNTFTTGTYTLTGTAGKTLNFLKSLTLDGADGTTQTFPSTSATVARTDAGQTFTGTQAFGAITATGTIVQTSASATAFESGPNGSTNPVFRLVNNTSSTATGISITGNAAGNGADIRTLSSGTNEGINFYVKGSSGFTFYNGATTSDFFAMSSAGTFAGKSNTLGTMYQLTLSGGGTMRLPSGGVFAFNSVANLDTGSLDSGISRISAGLLGVGTGAAGSFAGSIKATEFVADATVTAAGTTGAQTINKTAGAVNFAAAATSLVVTDSLVTASSIIQCTVATNDTTMKSAQCVAASGSFTVYANAAATAETRVNFWITN